MCAIAGCGSRWLWPFGIANPPDVVLVAGGGARERWNWKLSNPIRDIGSVVRVAPTLRTWRSLRVPVLDYSGSFGDTSDFRGIGSDQARFRKMGAMKVAAFLQLLELGRTVLVSDVDTVRVPRAAHTHARAGAARRSRRTLLRDRAPLDAAALLLPPRAALRSGWPTR